jgi:DNA-binding response OmpR family regulator
MSKHRLLVIEDDKDIADLVCLVASEADFDARAIHHFIEILSVYENFTPHVIVLDILMPGMDGFEVLNFLHQRGSGSRVIILSGQENYRPMAERMAEGFRLPIAATIAKPFRLSELRQTLENIKLSLPTPNGDSSSEVA